MSSHVRIALLFLAGALGACGHAHATVHTTPSNAPSFAEVQIGSVSVVATDKNAADNAQLQEKIRDWQALADQQLRQTVLSMNTQIVPAAAAGGAEAPTLTLTSKVRYGNRALRWAVGFGAGAGGVDSQLVATDRSGATLFQASAASDLAIGAAGGSIDKVFRKNLDELLQKYRASFVPRS